MQSGDVLARLAVIESRLQDVLSLVTEIREYVPVRVVEQAERLAHLERTMRSVVWALALCGGGLLSAFLAHVIGG